METAQSSLNHYGLLKPVHMSLVGCSDCLFALRGLGVLMGAQCPLSRSARRVSELIDSLLLLAGTSLWFALSLSPEAKPFRSTLVGIVKPLAALDRRQVSVAARGRAAQVREDLLDDGLLQDGGNDLQFAAAVRAVLGVELEAALEQLGPGQGP